MYQSAGHTQLGGRLLILPQCQIHNLRVIRRLLQACPPKGSKHALRYLKRSEQGDISMQSGAASTPAAEATKDGDSLVPIAELRDVVIRSVQKCGFPLEEAEAISEVSRFTVLCRPFTAALL